MFRTDHVAVGSGSDSDVHSAITCHKFCCTQGRKVRSFAISLGTKQVLRSLNSLLVYLLTCHI